jgi:hypothetical protein
MKHVSVLYLVLSFTEEGSMHTHNVERSRKFFKMLQNVQLYYTSKLLTFAPNYKHEVEEASLSNFQITPHKHASCLQKR